MKIEMQSEIACSVCGHRKLEEMPTDTCQFFYDCEACRTVLCPQPGDCCVFCSFGTAPCPSVQLQRAAPGGACAR